MRIIIIIIIIIINTPPITCHNYWHIVPYAYFRAIRNEKIRNVEEPFSARNVKGCTFVVVGAVGVGAVLEVQLKKRRVSPARQRGVEKHHLNNMFAAEVRTTRNKRTFYSK